MPAPIQLPETAKPKHPNQSEAGPAPPASPTAPMPRPASHLAPMPSDHPDFRSESSARLRCQPPRTNNCGTFKQPPSVAATSRPKPGNPFLRPPTKGTPPPKKKNHTEGCHTHILANPEPNTKHTETESPKPQTSTQHHTPLTIPSSLLSQNTQREKRGLPLLTSRPSTIPANTYQPQSPHIHSHTPLQRPISTALLHQNLHIRARNIRHTGRLHGSPTKGAQTAQQAQPHPPKQLATL
uniref:NewinterD n=1 Tax=Encephalitozoon cuniculi TaxID=6035 RepID=X5LV27_ENCCN|nr:NewinterD [Encephalitozoon cuniculi]